MASQRSKAAPPEPEIVAGNGLLHRRALLRRGILIAGAVGTGMGAALTSAAPEPLTEAPGA
jgi:sulfane dehydrogenase subunit SoxC